MSLDLLVLSFWVSKVRSEGLLNQYAVFSKANSVGLLVFWNPYILMNAIPALSRLRFQSLCVMWGGESGQYTLLFPGREPEVTGLVAA